MCGGQFAFISGSSFVLIGVLGVSPSAFGLCFGTVALGIMTGTFLSGRFGGRIGLDRAILAGTSLGAAAGPALAAPPWRRVPTGAPVGAPVVVFAGGPGLTPPDGHAGPRRPPPPPCRPAPPRGV